MKLRSFVALGSIGAIALTAAPAGAQGISSQCTSTISQDACQKAIDVFNYLSPQLGVVIAGGNATLGAGSALGGLGHVYVSGRANLVSADVPQINEVTPSVTGARRDTYPTKTMFAGIPQADADIGIFKGLPLGVTNVGGVDLLVSAAYLPSFSAGGVNIRTRGGPLKLGAGARVGIIQESIDFPGISATYLHRGLPTVDVTANNGADSLRLSNLDVSVNSYRLVASKSFLGFGLAAGLGRDDYTSKTSAAAHVAARNAGVGAIGGTPAENVTVDLRQTLSRNTYFLDASLNLPLVKLVGEIGQAASVKVPTYNSFAGAAPGASQVYGAIGVRFGL
jgi:hypothetical protein